MALPQSAMSSRDNVPGNFPSFEIDEQAADVVLGEERIDDLPCDGLVAVRDVDEVRAAIDCHHDPRIFAITADERVAELGVLPFAEGFVPVVEIGITGRLRACARSRARKPSGRWPGGVSANLVLIVELVWLSFEIVEKPWSDVAMMSVVSSRPSSLSAERMRARLSSALRIAARDVGPLIPGTRAFRLSP